MPIWAGAEWHRSCSIVRLVTVGRARHYHPEVAVPARGVLSDLNARQIMDHLHGVAFTGTLTLSSREKRKKLWFSQGEVFRVQSNLVPELLGRMMVDREWLTEADLLTCLNIQRELIAEARSMKKIGELVQEIHGIDADELKILVEQQSVYSLLQSLTWTHGDYEIQSLELSGAQTPILPYAELATSVDSLLDVTSGDLGRLFELLEHWTIDSKPVELSRVPLWSILATCRKLNSNGVLSVRRQNKLYEIILKYGIPLTLYEGTFGQPRQTIVVRQASDEHEKFFKDQLFRILSFLTGTVYFRGLQTQVADDKASSYLQFRDETGITKSVNAEEVPFELKEEYLKSQSRLKQWSSRVFGFFGAIRKATLKFLVRCLRHLMEQANRVLQKESS